MERLAPITSDEKLFIDNFADLHWHGQDPLDVQNWAQWHMVLNDEITLDSVKEIFDNGSPLIEFLKLVTRQNRYLDLNSGNVMLNRDNEYVLLDLEGFLKSGRHTVSSYDWLPQPDVNYLVALDNMATAPATAPIP